MESAVGDEGLNGSGYEVGVEQSAFVMSFLGPGVGKIYVQSLNALGRSVAGDEILGIAAEHADIGQSPTAGPVGGVLAIFVGPFDAQVVDPRVGPGCVYQKGSFAGAYFEFDGVLVVEEPGPVDWAVEVVGGEDYVFDGQGLLGHV